MSLHKISVLIGRLRRESFNRKLAPAMAMLALSDLSFEQVQNDNAHQATSV